MNIDGADLVAVGSLVAGQLFAFRLLQVVAPSTYFRTADLIDSQGDVTRGAVITRVTIPLAAGIVAAWASSIDAPIAMAAGGIAWLLIAWPALWLPEITRGIHKPQTWVLMAAFLLAWTAMPYAGMEIFNSISSDNHDGLLFSGVFVPVVGYAVTLGLGSWQRPLLAVRDKAQLDALHDELDWQSESAFGSNGSPGTEDDIAAHTLAGTLDRHGISALSILVLATLAWRRTVGR